jgi:replicative superfamily II helicase
MIFTNLSKIFQYVDLFNDFLLKFPKKEILDENFFISKILIYLDKKSPNTKLRLLIQNRIGYHHGRMDKYLRFLIECAYRAGELTLLICNSTLSKGINLSPEFLIIDYVPIRGGENINHQSKIEYINTIGRTGRMSQKMFIGNVFVI